MSEVKFQGRGTVYMAPRDTNGVPGAYFPICTDSFAIALVTTPFSHINKCGPVDVEDARGTKDQSGTLQMTFANAEDRLFALAAIGTVTAGGVTGSVSGEQLPDNMIIGDVYFLGGLTRHRAITSLVIGSLVLDTDYTLDAASGKVTALASFGSPAPTAAYSYTDPASVGIFTAPIQEYSMMYEFINKQNANDPGSLELYRVRLDPLSNLDMQSDEFQIFDIKGSVLADLTKDNTDEEFGQFGRRVL
jgi:hypothetical protein